MDNPPPGYVDLQINGFAGVNFATADSVVMADARDALTASGVAAFLPTLITAPVDELIAQANALMAGLVSDDGGAVPLGVHLEGPCINPVRRGAHNGDYIEAPSRGLADRLVAEIPDLAMVTVAPELVGAFGFIERLAEAGVVVSLGHSDANVAEANAGFDAGATAVTHLFNSMGPMHHRRPGLAGAALAREGIAIGLIADGVHVAGEAIDLVFRAAGDRVVLVTDAVAADGHDPYTPAYTVDGILAGSNLTMQAAIDRVVGRGHDVELVLAAATTNPRRLLAC